MSQLYTVQALRLVDCEEKVEMKVVADSPSDAVDLMKSLMGTPGAENQLRLHRFMVLERRPRMQQLVEGPYVTDEQAYVGKR